MQWQFTGTGKEVPVPTHKVSFLQGGHGWWAAWVEVSRTPDVCGHIILPLGVGALPTPLQFSTVQGSGEGFS